jgi:hypothetical protein
MAFLVANGHPLPSSAVQCLKTLRQQLHRVPAIVDLHTDTMGPMI